MNKPRTQTMVRWKAVWGPKRRLTALMLLALGFAPNVVTAAAKSGSSNSQSGSQHARQGPKAKPGVPSSRVKNYKIDDEVRKRSKNNPQGTTSVIVTFVQGGQMPAALKKYARGSKLDIINGQVLDLPNGLVKQLEANPEVFRVHHNRPIGKENYRTSVTVGAKVVNETLGYNGAGVSVAVIDSGIAAWHDDLAGTGATIYPYGNQRVKKFVDFVNGRTQPYDDNGHGSHVAGIIAGNGYDSRSDTAGNKSGIAPGASLVSLKVLDANGVGTISNIIAALNWVAVNHKAYNIRVVNVSVGAKINESYWTDPLTLAAKVVVEKGVVVVAASGNFGKNLLGKVQYGGITAPANAPWVLTVGASSTEGTLTRRDDVMASFSSNGPTYIDFSAKPDLVAPGAGTISLAVPGSTFFLTKALYLLNGRPGIGYPAYLTLSGTSMAAPVVSGTVALMMQANPSLTPNLVKAILQYTSEEYQGYSPLRQGAGFLNSLGAVRLARFYKDNRAGSQMPIQNIWSQKIIWGNHKLSGGYLNPRGNAWSTQIVWGAAKGLRGDDNIVWGTRGDDNIVWGTRGDDNIVWGTNCGGGCDNIVWGTRDASGDNIVWGTRGDDNIVWGTGGDDNIVWGTHSDDNIVWGTHSDDNIVWGTHGDDNIVWGTHCGGSDCDNIVWGTRGDDNIVWGTARSDDNIVWGTSRGDDNIVWGTSADADATWGSSGEDQVTFVEDEASEPLPNVALEFGDVISSDVTPAIESAVTTILGTVGGL
jgi:serine protease AprX